MEKSLEYLEAVLEKAKEFLPEELFKEIQRAAIPSAGGKAKSNQRKKENSLMDINGLMEWAKGRYPVIIEPKLNGIKTVISKKNDEVSLIFEGMEEEKNQIDKFKDLKIALEEILGDFVINADLGMIKNGKRVTKSQLNKFNDKVFKLEEGEIPVLTLCDLMCTDNDLINAPCVERRRSLERLFHREIGENPNIKLQAVKWANDEGEVKIAARWAFDTDMSEGLIIRDPNKSYEENGLNEIKKIVELKVIVLDKKEGKEKGLFQYSGGLILSDGEEWSNKKVLNGIQYINLGKTLPSVIEAEIGDIITVSILDLLMDKEKKELIWIGSNVLGVDRESKEPNTVEQAKSNMEKEKVIKNEINQFVPSVGVSNPKIAFVGASPNCNDGIRGEPFTGSCGQILKELFLRPLGLSRNDVFISNVVPKVLYDDNGQLRDPIIKDFDGWKDWIMKELDRVDPLIVVALGKVAKEVLKDRANFVMPHPEAIKKFGDSGEVNRKLKQVKKAMVILKKAENVPDDEGETSSEMSAKFWKDRWQDMYPTDGKGRFVYQHHWRGLKEEEQNLLERDLFNTDHSVHGDLRFEEDGGLWGFSVFLGGTEENKKGDKLINLSADDNLRGSFKIEHPKEWLGVGVDRPFISEPGKHGSASNSWGKIFAIDSGSYDVGVWKEHMMEIFVNGEKLKGRFILEYVPIEGSQRIWLIDKPEDQTPYAENNKLEDVIADLKKKGQKWLIWGKPNEKPQKINVQNEKIEKEYLANIIKADNEQQIVTGIVMEPDTVDAHGDVISAEEIGKAAHFFMENSRTIGDSHRKKAPADLIECYIATDDTVINNQNVKKGTWIISVKILEDDLWKKIKEGYYTGFSVGGFGIREGDK